MSSDGPLLKRKTIKLSHPNPLFEKWLKELRDEAASRNSDTQYAFAKALTSLKKYPLPLKSGKECLILENFGTRICLLLDRKLADYNKNQPETQDAGGTSKPEEEICLVGENEQPKVKKAKKIREKSNTRLNKSDKLYIPTLRSAPYAVLVALHEHLKAAGSPGEMTKSELQKAAQPLCDTSMFKPLAGSYYSGWSCVGQLVTRGLVQRRGSPHRFSLTEDGISLAEKLPIIDFDVSVTLPVKVPSPCKTDGKQPPVGRGKRRNVTSEPAQDVNDRTTTCSQPSQPFLQHEVLVGSDKDCLSQTSTSTQNSLYDDVIMVPGSFQVLLLVDTQEIHKGDELVKELQAQGVTLEVRRLKVGDFAWVGRNTAGQELLLPFIIERKRLDDLASSIKDGRFHEQKFRMKQSGVPHCMYLVESHGQRHYSLPTPTLLQAAANTQFVDRFTVKYTANSHETIVYIATFTKVLTRKFSNKTLLGCSKSTLPSFDIQEDCVSLMNFKEFDKLSGKTRKYTVKEMFIKQLVQLRGLSVEKALAIVERYPSPRSLVTALQEPGGDLLLADIPVGGLRRKFGPRITSVSHLRRVSEVTYTHTDKTLQTNGWMYTARANSTSGLSLVWTPVARTASTISSVLVNAKF